jgi:hypothetical protein
MNEVLLFYLAKPKYGGWATFTCHLHKGLSALGYKPFIIKQSNKTEKKSRDYGRKTLYQNLSTQDIIQASKKYPCIITAVDKTYYETAATLLAGNTPIVIHDPTELKQPITELTTKAKVITIRESMLKHIPHSTYLPHPYHAKTKLQTNTNRKPAVSLSRIDFDKHTEIIIEANKSLATPIDIYGYMNTIYSHFKLDAINPDWKNNYHGTFTADNLWEATDIATRYERVVDMSVIKKDGGGTQYTFLEAANAGAHLILNEGWQPTGLLADYAHTTQDHNQLKQLCEQQLPDRTQQAQQLLAHHNAKAIAKRYCETLSW